MNEDLPYLSMRTMCPQNTSNISWTKSRTIGVATYKRIYGDWSDARLKAGRMYCYNNSIHPHPAVQLHHRQKFHRLRMIIDAMDILYSGTCDGFVLVSSDSDFTRLATRLREAGMKVYGMGEKKTPKPLSWPATSLCISSR